MNNLHKILLALFAIVIMLSACNNQETYADMRDKENNAINRFISDSSIVVISEAQFKAQGETTNVDKNEYVLFETSGVYMQIVRQGCGKKIAYGETVNVLCRFYEYNILQEVVTLSNRTANEASLAEKMAVTNTYGTFNGTFNSSSSLMYRTYGSTAVPSGWLVPLRYVNIGRPSAPGEKIARVKIIVPASQGQYNASMNVHPYFYDITFERGI